MKCNLKIINRIKRSEGQLKGVLKLIEDGQSCHDLTIQLKAIESSIRQVINLLTIENLKNKVNEKHDIDFDEFSEEINLILKR